MSQRNTELDVLSAVRDYGAIGFFSGSHTEATKQLLELYAENDIKFDGVVSAYIDALVDSQHLLPVIDTKGVRQHLYARALTPKGARRLHELEHPVQAWMEANWFPFSIACVTTCVGAAGVVSSFLS